MTQKEIFQIRPADELRSKEATEGEPDIGLLNVWLRWLDKYHLDTLKSHSLALLWEVFPRVRHMVSEESRQATREKLVSVLQEQGYGAKLWDRKGLHVNALHGG